MDLRAPVPGHTAVVLADLVHAGARRDAKPFDGLARIQRHVHVHQQHIAVGDGEAVGAGHAGRIQQRVHHQGVGVGGRLFQEVGDEIGEFFRAVHAGVDRQAAGGLAVLALLAHRAEVAGAQEGGKIAVGVGTGVEPEPGKTQISRQVAVLQPALAVIERGRVIGQFLRLAVNDVEHAHR